MEIDSGLAHLPDLRASRWKRFHVGRNSLQN